MSVEIKEKGLDSFLSKLQKLKKPNDLSNKLASDVADRGMEIARNKYSTSELSIDIGKEQVGNNTYNVVASAEGLAFEEFGTGSVGRDSDYEGQLPTQTIHFETSAGANSTQGWVYNYDSPHKIYSKSGKVKGWFNPKTRKFTRGQKAGQQMYDTSVDLRKEVKDIAIKSVKEFINK